MLSANASSRATCARHNARSSSRRPRVLARAAADGERDALARSRMVRRSHHLSLANRRRLRSRRRPTAPGRARPSDAHTLTQNQPPQKNKQQQPGWETISQYLRQRSLRTVSPTEAQRMSSSANGGGGDWLVVDVRPPASNAKAAPKGAASVPLYVPLEVSSGGFDLSKGLKALAYALNGVAGVEPNLKFEQQLADALAKSGAQGAIFLCEAGGTLRATPNFPAGKSSRSLQACFRALRDDLLPQDRILHVTGGAAGWYRELGPQAFDGSYDAAEAGRTPNAASEPKGEFVEAAKEKMGMKE